MAQKAVQSEMGQNAPQLSEMSRREKKQRLAEDYSSKCVTCSREAKSKDEADANKFTVCEMCKSNICGECTYSAPFDTVVCTKCVSTAEDLAGWVDDFNS